MPAIVHEKSCIGEFEIDTVIERHKKVLLVIVERKSKLQ